MSDPRINVAMAEAVRSQPATFERSFAVSPRNTDINLAALDSYIAGMEGTGDFEEFAAATQPQRLQVLRITRDENHRSAYSGWPGMEWLAAAGASASRLAWYAGRLRVEDETWDATSHAYIHALASGEAVMNGLRDGPAHSSQSIFEYHVERSIMSPNHPLRELFGLFLIEGLVASEDLHGAQHSEDRHREWKFLHANTRFGAVFTLITTAQLAALHLGVPVPPISAKQMEGHWSNALAVEGLRRPLNPRALEIAQREIAKAEGELAARMPVLRAAVLGRPPPNLSAQRG